MRQIHHTNSANSRLIETTRPSAIHGWVKASARQHAAAAAQDTVARSRAEARQNLPSIINVQILGFGNEAPQSGASGARPADQAANYRPDNLVQVVGRGDLSPGQLSGLTADERRHLDL